MPSAVVFAYHNVGVRCLSVLLDAGVQVPLVLTHRDSPKETIWFGSVARLCEERDIEAITPEDANAPEVVARIAASRPDFLFSFYYRQMLVPAVLGLAPRGAFNMHGSLLPKYRGRVPVNWAVIRGERETGATLHEMVEKPDAGRIVGQQAVPILENDTAREVFDKVTVAAELLLHHAVPRLIAGAATLTPQNLAQGSYFGGRKPEDGIIDWRAGAAGIHNLVRGVAPPYPGAHTTLAGQPARILRTIRLAARHSGSGARLRVAGDRLLADCADGATLRVLELEASGVPLSPEAFAARFGPLVQLV